MHALRDFSASITAWSSISRRDPLTEVLSGHLFLLPCFILPSVPWRIIFQNNDHHPSPCWRLCLFEAPRLKQLAPPKKDCGTESLIGQTLVSTRLLVLRKKDHTLQLTFVHGLKSLEERKDKNFKRWAQVKRTTLDLQWKWESLQGSVWRGSYPFSQAAEHQDQI